jgi:energy-coupling factor transporter ATP-binding protein EcfA2
MDMKIKRLEIKNFRGIKDLTVDFTNPNGNALDLVAIAGNNASGKTSIIEACLFALGQWNLIPKPAKGSSINTTVGAESFQITAHIEHSGKLLISRIKDKQYTPTVKNAETEESASLPAFSNIEYFPSWRAPKLVGSVSVTTGRKGRKPEDTLENRLWNLKQFFIDLTARKSFSDTTKDKIYYEKQEAEAFSKINTIWNILYPGKNEQIIAGIAGEQVGSGFDLYLTGRNGNKIPVDALSSGEIEALTMLGRHIISSLKNGIVFIDEPELHLHPAWQRNILKAMIKVYPETQLIIATHSPQILGGIDAESVFVLQREKGKSQMQRANYAYGLDSNRVLEELMDAPERLPEIKEKLHEIFVIIRNGNLKDAKEKIRLLKEELPEEPELTRAEALIARKEILAK